MKKDIDLVLQQALRRLKRAWACNTGSYLSPEMVAALSVELAIEPTKTKD